MTLDKDHLVRLVAEKHKIILSENDPILAMVALNDVILDLYSHKIDAAITRLELAVDAATLAHMGVLKEQTEQALGQAIYGLKKVIDTGTAGMEKVINGSPVALPPMAPPTVQRRSNFPALMVIAALSCLVAVLCIFIMTHHQPV